MQFSPPLQPATLLKRYKRFLADVRTPQGELLTLHCANTGAMTGCATPGDTVWYSTSNAASRRYPHSWELTQTTQGDFICVNTLRANKLVAEALAAGRIAELSEYQQIRAEVRYTDGSSRFDFLLSAPQMPHGDLLHRDLPHCYLPHCYLEVKSVTLAQESQGYFPDTITERGQKHLRELINIVQQGGRAALLFAVMHSAISRVAAAAHLDPRYAQLLTEAHQCGVRLLAYKANISPTAISLDAALPVSTR